MLKPVRYDNADCILKKRGYNENGSYGIIRNYLQALIYIS